MRFDCIIQNDSAIQYKIELLANGFIACPGSTLPAATSLRMLREQEDAWRRCEWKEVEKHVVRSPVGYSASILRNGIWAYGGHNSETNIPPLDRNATVIYLDVGSSVACKDGWKKTAQCSFDNVNVLKFAIDPLMDLLVLVEGATM